MQTSNDPIDMIEGPRGNKIASLRKHNAEFDDALMQPNTILEKKRRKNDVEIAGHLVDYGWEKSDIREVLMRKHFRSELIPYDDDAYMTGVLEDAGYEAEEDEGDVDSVLSDHGLDGSERTNDSVDVSALSRIKF